MKVTKYAFFGGLDENARGNGAYASACSGFSADNGGALVKGPGFEEFLAVPAVITGIWSGVTGGKRIVAYVSGTDFYTYDFDTHTVTDVGFVSGGKTAMFEFGGFLYLLNTSGYYKYNGASLSSVEGYIPLIAVSTTPDGAGTEYESLNMLTPKRRQKFTCDGEAVTYRLAESSGCGYRFIFRTRTARRLPSYVRRVRI